MKETYKKYSHLFAFLTLYTLSSVQHLSAQIFECKRITEGLKHIKPGSLIIFDLDNTVFEPTTSEGSDQWFTAHVHHKMSLGHTYHEALDIVLPRYYELQHSITMQLVEEYTALFINFLQENGYPVIALTARAHNAPLIKRTHEFLSSLHIDFSKTAPHLTDAHFDTPYPLWYEKGIVFSGRNDKGTALKTFLKAAHYRPTHIVCFDDKRKYLEDIEKMTVEENIPFSGLRYGFLDEKISQFTVTL